MELLSTLGAIAFPNQIKYDIIHLILSLSLTRNSYTGDMISLGIA